MITLLEALMKWEDKLLGRKFTLVTDHKGLEYFKTQKNLLVWGLLKVFLPKACLQQSIAQLFEATAELGLTKGELDKYERMWRMVWLSRVTVTVTWLLELVWMYAEF